MENRENFIMNCTESQSFYCIRGGMETAPHTHTHTQLITFLSYRPFNKPFIG